MAQLIESLKAWMNDEWMNDFIKNHTVEPCDSKKHDIGIYNMNIYTGPVNIV